MPTRTPRKKIGVVGAGARVAQGDNIFIAEAGAQVSIGDRSTRRVPTPSEHAPLDYVDRSEVTGPLLAYLLAKEPAPKGRAIISAVHGLGGIGKTTVAQWLTWRPEIEQRFCDGRIWVTLGTEPPEATTVISDCVSQFDPTFKTKSTVEAARADLAALLQDRSVLFVIDDVWPGKSAEAAKALLVPSPGSRFLLTTRFPQLADDPEIRAEDFPLDEMSVDQAVELIVRALGRKLGAEEQPLAKRLCEIVGGHALALELAAARLREGRPWKTLLDDLAAEVARLETLDETDDDLIDEPTDDERRKRRRSVRASLLLSVRYLNRDGQRLFAWFGVVAEEAIITPPMATTLWSVDEEKADKHLRTLSGLGLLSPKGYGYGIHDLMHDLARELLTAPEAATRAGDIPGFGLTLQGARQQFLERHRAKTSRNLWHTLPDDDYIHDHLVRHFEQARWDSEIERLLWEESADGHCGWYQARERLGQTAGFLGDVGQVWSYADRLATAAASEGLRSRAIALQLHCAMIITSINSLSAGIPVEVLVGAVRCGVLALPSALALARQNPEPRLRVDALLALQAEADGSRHLNVLREALGAARVIDDAQSRAEALAEVAERLPADDQRAVFTEALSAARGIDDAWLRAKALAEFTRRLPPEEALAVARSINVADKRAEALAEVAERLPEEEALAVARGIVHALSRAGALAEVARRLPPEEALAVARSIDVAYWRAEALAEVAERLPEEDRPGLFDEALRDEALRAARRIRYDFSRAMVLVNIAQRLPPERQSRVMFEALSAARSINCHAECRAQALAEVAQRLPAEEALEVARSVDACSRVRVLATLTERLSAEEALAAAHEVDDAYWRARALAEVAQRLPMEDQPNVLGEALSAVRRIGDAHWRSRALERASEVPPTEKEQGVLSRVLGAARVTAAALFRTGALPVAGQVLPSEEPEPADVLTEALSASRGIGDAEARAWALEEVAQRVPTEERVEVLGEALNAARDIYDARSRALALSAVAERLPTEKRAMVLCEALIAARCIDHAEPRAWTLAEVAQRFGQGHIIEQLIHHWIETARILATHKRSECVADFAAITPFIRAFGGEAAVHGLGCSIHAVGKWWP